MALTTVTTADTTTATVSIVGSIAYVGDGTIAKQIGTVDITKNGTGGQPLRINLAEGFTNSGFELGDSTNWTFVNDRIDLGVTVLAGFTSQDTSDYSANTGAGGNDNDAPVSATYTSTVQTSVKNEGSYALRLQSNMTTANSCDVVHGPGAFSSDFNLTAGDQLYFDWKAQGGSDWFDAFGYLVNTANGNQIELLDTEGSTATRPWVTATQTISTTGTYKFVFVNGTFDATCGRAAGGTLYIDNIRIIGQRVTDAMVQQIAQLVTYRSSNTTTLASGTKTVTLTAAPYDNGVGGVTTGSTTITINVSGVAAASTATVPKPGSLLTFMPNGADNFAYPQSPLLGETVPLWKNMLVRAGYTFAGWNTKADGTGTAYADQALFKFSEAFMTLHAQWKLIQSKPTITWATPAAIQEGTALSATQLNALASVAGTYTYAPAATAVLPVGKHPIKVTFVPTSPLFETIETTIEIEVLAKAKLTWANPAAIVEGTALGATQLNATASVPGAFSYAPAAGTVLAPGRYTLRVTFTPTDTRLSPVTAEVTLDVTAKPVVVEPAPGAPLSPTYAVTGGAKTSIKWGAGKDAATYTVLVDGKSACSVGALTCDVSQLLGPKNVVTVTSVAANTKTSAAVPATYAAPESAQVLSVINFDSARAVIKSSEASKLRAFAAKVRAAGYTSLTVYGHTDSVGGVDNRKLSVSRANATITYLKKILPGVKFTVSGFAASEPVGDNSTADGKAANRRAEIFIP